MIISSDTRHANIFTLLNAVTVNGTSNAQCVGGSSKQLYAQITGTGLVSGTLNWYGTLHNATVGGALLATTTLSGTGADYANFFVPNDWSYIYVVLSSISGTGATVTAEVGV